jgi:hypothetical protein
MPKVTFNKLVDHISGRIGNFIFYQADGQNLSRTVPQVKSERTAKQKTNSERFLAAQKYAGTALQDPAVKAAYKAACRGHQNPRNLAIRDAMRPPVVEWIDLSGYTGKPGQIVRVKATDDFRVVEVKVTLRGPGGELIEEGVAVVGSAGGGVAVHQHGGSGSRAIGSSTGGGQGQSREHGGVPALAVLAGAGGIKESTSKTEFVDTCKCFSCRQFQNLRPLRKHGRAYGQSAAQTHGTGKEGKSPRNGWQRNTETWIQTIQTEGLHHRRRGQSDGKAKRRPRFRPPTLGLAPRSGRPEAARG